MRHETKSVIIGRKQKTDEDGFFRTCFVALYDMNNPHKVNEVPKDIIEFERKDKIVINGFNISYLLGGNDLVINNLEYVEIKEEGDHLVISGKQS